MARAPREKNARQERVYDPDKKPDPEEIIIHGLGHWVAVRRKQILPPPCPNNFRECALWWRRNVQEPEDPRETFEVSTPDGSGKRWETGYANRCRNTLLVFLDLGQSEREFILAAREDVIFWHGEPVQQFTTVIEETMQMRRMGVEAYREKVFPHLRKAIAKMQTTSRS